MDNNQINNNIEKSNERNGRGLFYGIIAIATFIIMAVGATYAYFTATTRSLDNAVQTGSTTLQLDYISYEAAWMNNDLIPADTNVVEYSFEYQNDTTKRERTQNGETLYSNYLCKDDDGNSICSVYVFQVRNTARSDQSVSLDIESVTNTFTNLKAMTYQIEIDGEGTDYNNTEGEDNLNGEHDPIFQINSDDDRENKIKVKNGNGEILDAGNYNPIYVNRKGVKKTLLSYVKTIDEEEGTTEVKPSIDMDLVALSDEYGMPSEEERTAKIADNININGLTTKTFAIVLYIKNLDRDQTREDAEKVFSGRVIVKSGDGSSGVSGIIGLSTPVDLQSGESFNGNVEQNNP